MKPATKKVMLGTMIAAAGLLGATPTLANSFSDAVQPAQAPLSQNQAMPDLPDYYAYAAPIPPLSERVSHSFRWMKNFYITGEVGKSLATINSINNFTPLVEEEVKPRPVTAPNFSDKPTHFGAAVGYQLRHSGFFSRLEIEYIRRGTMHYDQANALKPRSGVVLETFKLNSNIENDTLLGKVYYDFDYGIFIIPYLQAGAGMSFNKVKSSGVFTLSFPPNDPPFPPVIAASEHTFSDSNFAWEGGAGIRIRINPHLFLGAAYEYDKLGNLAWKMDTVDSATGAPTQPVLLQSKSFYSNTVSLSLTLKA